MLSLFADAAGGDVDALTKRMNALTGRREVDPPDGTPLLPPPAGVKTPEIESGTQRSALHSLCRGFAHGWPQWDEARRAAVRDWIIARLRNDSLPASEFGGEDLSALPVPLIEAINAAFE
jgi:hypothetical protein